MVHLSRKAHTFWSASFWLSPRISHASTKDTGFFRPSCFRASAFLSQGTNTLTPVWNSAQNFTSSENLAHSMLASSARASRVDLTFLSRSMN